MMCCLSYIRRAVAALTVVMLLTLATPATAAAQAAPLVVAAGQIVEHDLATTGRSIVVHGEVQGDVTTWSGSILIEGSVQGDVVSYTGDVVLGADARVAGNILVVEGSLQTLDGAQVAGFMIEEQSLARLPLAASMAPIILSGDFPALELPRVFFSALIAGLALIIVLGVSLFWPRRTYGAGLVILRSPGRSLLVGLLSSLLLAASFALISTLVILSLVGSILLIPLVLLIQVPYLLGLATLARALAARFAMSLQAAVPATAFGTTILLLPLVALGSVHMLWGAVLFYLLASIGLGALVVSRGGTYQVAVPVRG
jgi:hypothetical protein